MPRIYLTENLAVGKTFPLPPDRGHYLSRVMRTDKFLAFGNGEEFLAELKQETNKKTIHYSLLVVQLTGRPDPSGNMTLAFAPIKQARLEEMLNMATQLGVAALQPVITDRTDARNINWERIRKITTEAAEQSGRNSIPEIRPPVKFGEFVADAKNLVFADERFAHEKINVGANNYRAPTKSQILVGGSLPLQATIFIGPEGGFSSAEFAALDAAKAVGISLGKTILRAETAAAVAIALVTK
ncbi:MAG: 16S rRNA (uracil(1498)-N(3))-methyltransferase [Proteobacteria bacterium]|nr:16S rRNA (uracil(1498)-N(3))-methyltransferase [Pseudomonadota bacterium]